MTCFFLSAFQQHSTFEWELIYFSGAYILLDLVLGRMNKGAREIDIAATLEHLRDQRAALVATRQQFEFVLMAVAEEVSILIPIRRL